MWFFRKKPIHTVFFDIGGVAVTAPMDHFEDLSSQIFHCKSDHLLQSSVKFLPLLETGKITSQEFWENVGSNLASLGIGRMVPGWKFKGFWESLLLDHLTINEEILALAGRLKRHATVGVLSNVISEHAVVLQKHGVYQPFRPVILSCQIGLRKPESAAYLKAAELARSQPEHCLLIDDLSQNLEGARKVGFRTILYEGQPDDLARQLHRLGLL